MGVLIPMAIHYRKEGADYCVYGHFKDDGGIFYVGISSNRTRPYDYEARTQLWKNVAKKYGVSTKILADNLTKEEAITIESEMILSIGRICMKDGPLTNFLGHHYEHYRRTKPTVTRHSRKQNRHKIPVNKPNQEKRKRMKRPVKQVLRRRMGSKSRSND